MTAKERLEAEKIARDAAALAAYNDFLIAQNAARLAALLADLLELGVGGIGGSVTQTDIDETVNTAIASLVSTAPSTLNTLVELAAALNNDANFSTTITNALAVRLRFDAAQSLTSSQKLKAHDNLGTFDATVNQQTVTAYTLQTVDNDGKTYLRMYNAAANTVTIPTSQTKPISISCRGSGLTTLVAGAGVTLNGTLAFTAQHQTKTVIPLGGGSFDVVG